jgi:hypothetical protein
MVIVTHAAFIVITIVFVHQYYCRHSIVTAAADDDDFIVCMKQ